MCSGIEYRVMSRRRSRKKPNVKKTPTGPSNGRLMVPDKGLVAKLFDSFNDGDFEVAAACALELCEQHSDNALGWKSLGTILNIQGKHAQAAEMLQKALDISPSDYELHNNLGLAQQSLGKLAKAEASYQKAIELKPDFAAGYNNLGNAQNLLGRSGQAEQSYRSAISLRPDYVEAHNNLGTVLQDTARLEASEVSFKQAISFDPAYAKAHSNLGISLVALGRASEAEESYRQAIQLDPNLSDAHNNLGNLLIKLGRVDEAIASISEAVRLNPESAPAHNNLGLAVIELGWFKEARLCFERAKGLRPDYHEAFSNMLFVLNYDDQLGAPDLYREYEAYGVWATARVQHRFDHGSYKSVAGRRLRVGYSSPDFRGHVCRFFMEPLFSNHDNDQFELFAYSNAQSPDQHTDRMRKYFDHWVDVTQLTDEQMAQRIYDDQLDILVDVAGHTTGHRLGVFAMRPAPIQASSPIGYAYTTGLKEIDYFICDENLVPAGSEPYFSEQPWRLPAPCLSYAPPREDIPELSELPALRKGYVTFGSLTRLTRLNDPLLRTWGEILHRVPRSRLRLDQKPFAHAGTREVFWQRLEGLGIARDRVDLTSSSPHWDAYREIDITLDCWPHNAGVTTIDSLMMGVPVLSKLDRPSVGRVGAMYLAPAGLSDWLVDDEESFIEKAVAVASDLDALTTLRKQLRSKLEKSPLLDGAVFTQNLENAYREMVANTGVND